MPGAGVALVGTSGVEWAGGIGLADCDSGAPVTADTRFRAGSMSKTFIAMTLAQMDEDGEIDLNATVAELAPEVPIDNAWEATDPVRVIHLLQHTAGFDDNHFNEVFGTIGAPDRPLPADRRAAVQPCFARRALATRHAHVVLEPGSGSPATSSKRSAAGSTKIALPSTSSSLSA